MKGGWASRRNDLATQSLIKNDWLERYTRRLAVKGWLE